MSSKSILIQCSARSDGDSATVCKHLSNKFKLETIDIRKYDISYYDYDTTRHDDFIPLVRNLSAQYDKWIFVTPVYWYTISGRMKVFLDRTTELLKEHKELGRTLRGKCMGLISVSNDHELQEWFEVPVKMSASYLGMNYMGHVHSVVTHEGLDEPSIDALKKYFTLQL